MLSAGIENRMKSSILKADDIEDDKLDFSAEEIAWACEKYGYGKDGE